MATEHKRLQETMGDPRKRTCRYYGTCDNLKELWEDETGTQLSCAVCGAAVWAGIELAD
jgi:hypothetical protein